MGIIVRRATKADIPALIRLNMAQADYHAKLDPFFKTGVQMKQKMRPYFEKQLRRRVGRVFIAEEGKRVVGFIIFEIQKSSPAASIPRVGSIRTIFVDQKARRSGAGSMLLDAAVQWLKLKNMNRLEIGVLPTNSAGLNFWMKKGFKERMKRMWKKI
jgi:GNAT superfamily N-acetyltransferase